VLGIAGNVTNSCDTTYRLLSNRGSVIFDGSDDFVDASTVSSRISKLSGTISHWVRITTSANNEVLFSCSDGTSGSDKVQTVFMTATSSGQFQAVYKAGGTAYKAVYNFAASSIPGAGWFHLAMTYDKVDTDLTIKLYFNGVLQNTFSGTADTIGESVTFDRVILGKNANADNSYLTGYMDECAYFSRVLSATEIARIYNETGKFNYAEDLSLTGSANALKQWLRFGDGRIQNTSDTTSIIFDMGDTSLGSEKIVNGGFDSDSIWTKTNATIDNGVATVTVPEDGQYSALFQSEAKMNGSLISGEAYILKATVNGTSGKEMRFQDDANNLGGLTSANGVVALTGSPQNIEICWVANSNSNGLNIARNTGAPYTFTVDNVSVKKIEGNFGFCSGTSNLINQNNLPG